MKSESMIVESDRSGRIQKVSEHSIGKMEAEGSFISFGRQGVCISFLEKNI